MFELAHVKRELFKHSLDLKADTLPKAWEKAVMRRACYSRDDADLSGFLQRFSAIPSEQQGIYVGMTDGAINELAKDCAVRCEELVNLYKDAALIRAACARLAVAKGAPPIVGKFEDAGAIARYLDAAAWRRILRTAYNKLAESMAIQLGVVHAKNDLYVTNESVNRRTAQNDRNARSLNDTYLENEAGQVFSLAELSALSTSNKSIKRSELMIRLAGFDLLAQKSGHVGDFITLTCPSRMHAVHRTSGLFNENYDKTSPKQANDYLCKLWSQVRSVWAKAGVQVYGFRMVEPHHDGCPHWHMVLFFEPSARRIVRRTLIKYGLKDNGSEAGAWKNRVKCMAVDFDKGGASAYLAKYIAKNIDGYKVGKDLLGNDALTSSQRVEAWAATWKVRQFQQIGGAPVGVWRALRKVKNLSMDAPQCLRMAHDAVNYATALHQQEGKQGSLGKHGWLLFNEALGGAMLARKERPIQLHKVWFDTVGKYGDTTGNKIRGVAANDHIAHGVYFEWKPASAAALQKKGVEITTHRPAPWIHVSNCNPHQSAAQDSPAIYSDFEPEQWQKNRIAFARRSAERQKSENDYINHSEHRRKLAA
jgi:Bacteriophage replication gene A protein (GPA)